MINVLVADDHTILREGIKLILSETCDITVVDEAQDSQEVLRKTIENYYDVLVLDLSMPGVGGLEVLKQIKMIKPSLPVLILSMYGEAQYAVRTIKAGASGYLTKSSASEKLVNAIRTVSVGRKFITPTVAESLACAIEERTTKEPMETLSDREYQVMCMIASGKTVTEIAKELALSIKSISTYRARILKKMSFQNNAEMTHYSIKAGLI